VGAAPQGPLPQLTERPRPRRLRRRLWLVLLLALLAVLVGIALNAVALLGVAGDLSRGRDALSDARRAVGAGNLDEAATAFDRAGSAMASAGARAEGGWARVASWVPFLGNNVDAATGLARAGEHLARAGTEITEALARLPDGLGSLAPSGGRLPLDAIEGLSAPLGAARAEAELAVVELDASPDSFLAPPLAEARWDAHQQTAEVVDALRAGELLTGAMPRFAGRNAPTRYLLVAENPAELRGTGGLWGAYSIVTFRGGTPKFSAFRPIQSLPDVDPDLVPPPSPDFRRNYDQFGGAGYWLNINMTPDFPSAARAALSTYELGVGERLDGVISADPFVLASMLELTGPVHVPGVAAPIDADSVVAFTTNEAYTRFTRPDQRKALLGAVAQDVFERFLGMDGHGIARLKALGGAVADGHLKIFSRDGAFQAGLEAAGVTGGMAAPTGDLLSVTVDNGSGGKLDYYATRRLSYDVQLGGDGEAIATTDVEIVNAAPSQGEPRYVIGPFVHGAEAGELRPFTWLWCHQPCEVQQVERDGEASSLDDGSELGVPWYREYRSIPPGQTGHLHVVTRTSGVWDGDASSGSYRLTFLGQTTIRPTEVTITIRAPEGTDVVWTSEPMRVQGGVATWTGSPAGVLQLEVRFRAPLPLRWWRNASRLLS